MASPVTKPILPYLEGREGELRKMRFWSKVDIRGPEECWDWQASKTSSGYGRFKIASYNMVHANRMALIMHVGIEPAGLMVLHSCDRPQCCNPHHLRFGTHQDNMDDKTERGRNVTGDQAGENNPRAKLTEAQLALVIARFKLGWNNKRIAADLPVDHALISRIRVGRSWRSQAAALGWQPNYSPLAPICSRNSPSPTPSQEARHG